jgi:hypothetical protein
MAEEPVHRWKIETADRYNKIVTSVISLATGAFLLPVMFLRQFLGIPAERALKPFLNCAAYVSWACLGCSVLCGLAYSWLSIKWVKQAWGQKVTLPERWLEGLLNLFFGLMFLLFVIGIVASVYFFVTVHAAS